ncbi:helix-turn-helix domain-containing protein [Neolewinella persica]|uniref:helix-turn-helix domain-containing protein n=1 Tax=Neolewinella persica TaxID=70998 RepID=UPI00037476DE|nr:helix-turn-helix transcriptional regulator [Neolewinella persica]
MKNAEEVIHQYDPKRIVDARKSKGYSQEELAFAAGLSLRTVQRIEKGSVRPRLYSLRSLAEALDCAPDQFRQAQESTPSSSKRTGMNWMTLSVYSVVILPFLPMLLQAILWHRAKDITVEEDLRYRESLHFQGRWLAGLLITLFALPLVTQLLTGQVRYGDFPLASLIYLLFVGINLASTFSPKRSQPLPDAMA